MNTADPKGSGLRSPSPGSAREELDIPIEENQLVIRGRQVEEQVAEYLHRGIAARQFQRTFVLADGIEVWARI